MAVSRCTIFVSLTAFQGLPALRRFRPPCPIAIYRYRFGRPNLNDLIRGQRIARVDVGIDTQLDVRFVSA